MEDFFLQIKSQELKQTRKGKLTEEKNYLQNLQVPKHIQKLDLTWKAIHRHFRSKQRVKPNVMQESLSNTTQHQRRHATHD